jgi:hypothetical protein
MAVTLHNNPNRAMTVRLALKIKALVHELGLGTSVLYMVDKLLRRIPGWGIYDYHFVAQDLSDKPRLTIGRGKKYELQWLSGFDPLLSELDRPESVFIDRFAQGAECLAATRDGRLVGCIWHVRDRYIEDEVRVDFLLQDKRLVWDFDVFVADSERLGFLFARMWDVFDARLRSQGAERSLSRINGFNARSMHSHRRLGAQPVGWATFVKLGQLQLMVASKAPYLHLSGSRRPRLGFAPAKDCPPD